VIGLETFIKEPALFQKEQVIFAKTSPIIPPKEVNMQKMVDNKIVTTTSQPTLLKNNKEAIAQTIYNEPSNLAAEAVAIEK
jgi:hypothetical protein